MTKRMWFIVAGAIAVTACGTGTGVCETPVLTMGENRGRDQTNYAECVAVPRGEPATAPIPTVQP